MLCACPVLLGRSCGAGSVRALCFRVGPVGPARCVLGTCLSVRMLWSLLCLFLCMNLILVSHSVMRTNLWFPESNGHMLSPYVCADQVYR